MDPVSITVLKYLGLAVATASAIWGLLGRPIAEDAAGRRRVTRAGWVSLGLIAVGALISGLSTLRESQLAHEAKRAADRAQARRAPLQRLSVRWTFTPTDRSTPKPGRSGRQPECVEDESPRGGERLALLYPWLGAYPGEPMRARDVVALLPLDSSASRVLPLGMIAGNRGDGEDTSTHLTTDRLRQIAATVEFREDLEQCLGRKRSYRPPRIERTRTCPVEATLTRGEKSVTASWDLDPTCIGSGVDRVESASAPTAEFPERMVVVVLVEIGGLPFAPSNFALNGRAWLRWDELIRRARAGERSTLTLVANGETADPVVYELAYQGSELMGAKGGGAYVEDDFPRMKIWTGARAPRP